MTSMVRATESLTSLPLQAGIGLRAPHHHEVLLESPAVSWWEVHSENYFVQGGPALDFLDVIRTRYPLSLHGVSSSLGGVDTLFERHIKRLKRLVDRIEPAAVSEHLCWSSSGEEHYNDLLPLPYTHEALQQICDRIGRTQDLLGRKILIENVSSYVQWAKQDFAEWDFLVETSKRSGCGILLDVNNVFVSAKNHGFDATEYIDAIPSELVHEIHLAGYDVHEDFLVDTHGKPVHEPVWQLYTHTLARIGPKPTLIEWDTNIPPLQLLMREAAKAEQLLTRAPSANAIGGLDAVPV